MALTLTFIKTNCILWYAYIFITQNNAYVKAIDKHSHCGIIMQRLLITAVFLFGIDATSASKISLPVRHILAERISQFLYDAKMTQIILIPHLIPSQQRNDAGREYRDTLKQAIASQPNLLEDYIQLWQDPSLSTDKFAQSIYGLARDTADKFVKEPILHDGNSYSLEWKWTDQVDTSPITARERKSMLAQSFASFRQGDHVFSEKQGSSSLSGFYSAIADDPSSSEKMQKHVNSRLELLEAYPLFDTKLNEYEIDHLIDYIIESGGSSIEKLNEEIDNTIKATMAEEVTLQKLLTNHGLEHRFIEKQLSSIQRHLYDKQVVIIGLENDQSLITIPNKGDDQDLEVIGKLRTLKQQDVSRYLAFWRQDAGQMELGYTLLERDKHGGWKVPPPDRKSDIDSISMHEKISPLEIFNKQARGGLKYLHPDKILGMYSPTFVFDVTFSQLKESKFIFDSTRQFLFKMGWNWYKFGKTIYPNNRKKAELFIATYEDNLIKEYADIIQNNNDRHSTTDGMFKDIQVALESLKSTLSSTEKITTIDFFLSDLNHLVAKSSLIAVVITALKKGYLTDDEKKRQLLEQAIDNYRLSFIRLVGIDGLFDTFAKELFKQGIPIVFDILNYLLQHGLTNTQIRQKILTDKVLNNLIEDIIVPEHNLNAMRDLLSEQKVRSIIDKLSDVEDKNALVMEIMTLPFSTQLQGLAKKLINGLSSNENLLTVLHNVEEKSMYKPVSTMLIDLMDNMQSSKEKIGFISNIRETLNTAYDSERLARKKYFLSNRSFIVYFVAPIIDSTGETVPFIKVGQIEYDEKYVLKDGSIDLKELSQHKRFKKEIFAAGIDYKIIHAASPPAINDNKMHEIILESFGDKRIRRANQEQLKGISSGDGITEFFEIISDDVVIVDNAKLIAIEKLNENVKSIAEASIDEALTRFMVHGYVPVTKSSTPHTSSSGSTKYLTTKNTGFLQWELPVKLNPEKKQHNRETLNPKANSKTLQAAPRAPPTPKSKEQLRLEAEEEAERKLNEQSKQLARIIEREGVPTDTPPWLHLRTLISYTGTSQKNLANYAGIRKNKERFFAIIAQDTATLPSSDELKAIEQALTKYVETDNLTDSNKKRILNVIDRDMELIKQNIEKKKFELARPNPAEKSSEKKEVNDDIGKEVTDNASRTPYKNTLKKISAADVDNFLHGELRPTYRSFSELMLELDVNTVQELTAKLNETLIAVNARIASKQEKIQLLSTPFHTHLIGYELGTSNFRDITLGKLQIIAEHIEHPEQDKIVRLIEDIIRAAHIQYYETVEQLNNALQNYEKKIRSINPKEFVEIQKLTDKARKEWAEDWLPVSAKVAQ